jgi:mono/diheme cytochrome c family protein
MPSFVGVLTDSEIRAVLAFIQSTWPAEIRDRRAAMTRN